MNSRNNFIDYVKGVTIILVVIGHVIQYIVYTDSFYSNPAFILIYSFHMPLFMAISGYLFYRNIDKPIYDSIIKRLNQLLIPLFLWTILAMLVSCFSGLTSVSGASDFLVKYLKLIPRFYWYIWVLFICTILFLVINKYLNNWYLHLIPVILLFLLPDFSTMKHLKNMYPYFLLGLYFNMFQENLLKKKNIIFILSAILFLAGLVHWDIRLYIYKSGMQFIYKDHIAYQQILTDLLRFTIGISGCITVTYLLNIFFNKAGFKFISELGQKSLGIYVIHLLILQNLPVQSFFTFTSNTPVNTIIFSIIILGLSHYMTILMMKSEILNKYLFGSGSRTKKTELARAKTQLK